MAIELRGWGQGFFVCSDVLPVLCNCMCEHSDLVLAKWAMLISSAPMEFLQIQNEPGSVRNWARPAASSTSLNV